MEAAEVDGENTVSQSLSTGLVLSAYQFLKLNTRNNSNSTQENLFSALRNHSSLVSKGLQGGQFPE